MRTKYIYSLHKMLHKLHFRPHNSEFEGDFTSCITHSIFLNPYIFSSSLINYMVQGMTKCFPKVYWFLNAKWWKGFSMILDFCILLELRGGFIYLKDSLRQGVGKYSPWANSGLCSFQVCELWWFLHCFSVVKIKRKKKKKDMGLRGMQSAKPKILTVWYFTEKVYLSCVRPSELLFQLE